MKNTRKQNIVIYIINNEGKKLYYKGYSHSGQRLWTSNIENARKTSIGEARRYIINTLYNHKANYEVVE